ncbi:hypothetical protein COT75_04905 [Candidatus Beckwithbacteria bacterium CG10_big_fil_rev_8_21_14_0_10_34_10]|uniref:GDP-Man:Man(1)GlcNAc(2)-PP-Dol alpha-1,3-mannosyltransferase n=1 Tax=Candidatus Beckwithbacteria bacterium CG10_big_fil_rev_8_21_14_0_10_34_10 TaxID=1974495 RepID=A0A2H0W807_9BACT|nr:MAG: hypothetical protein COT75_04905 [Candidatus Beckwithbacteria bacterium CG10_big_fil_rev_8_21_14_0_10_34_10]
MKIALVHDYLYTYGGAERVLEAFHEIWPQAPIYTAWVDWNWLKKKKPEWQNWKIVPSWFDKIPFKKNICSPLRFLAPKIWRSFNFNNFDLVISSSAWYMAKGVSLKKGKEIHVCYCHTPPRYLYGYPTALNFKRFWWGRLYANLVNPFLRIYDYKSSQTIDHFICNSREVQKRIKKFYKRKAKIIYPPVFNKEKPLKEENKIKKVNDKYFLMVNRLVRHKNVDLAIKACKKLRINLKIVGQGPEEKRLKKLTGSSQYIKFLDFVDDKKLSFLYRNCQAAIYLAEKEDFGMIPIEAMSFGKPVIALRSGGIPESIIENKTGTFINKVNLEELVNILKLFNPKTFKKEDCFKQARKFSKEGFKKEVIEFIQKNL